MRLWFEYPNFAYRANNIFSPLLKQFHESLLVWKSIYIKTVGFVKLTIESLKLVTRESKLLLTFMYLGYFHGSHTVGYRTLPHIELFFGKNFSEEILHRIRFLFVSASLMKPLFSSLSNI